MHPYNLTDLTLLQGISSTETAGCEGPSELGEKEKMKKKANPAIHRLHTPNDLTKVN